MAQDYVGANNLPLLEPLGQFGTRMEGGGDSASPRYIFTRLSDVARLIYHPSDSPLLRRQFEDGQEVEPEYFLPIIPMALVNSPAGIGTGWSSSVPAYNPLDLIENVRRQLRGEELQAMTPYVHGFKGKVERVDHNTYATYGIVKKVDDTTYEISELPVGMWTTRYKEYLERVWVRHEAAQQVPKIRALNSLHTDREVRFVMDLGPASFKALTRRRSLADALKLRSTLRTSNMVLFDPAGKIRRSVLPLGPSAPQHSITSPLS
eukprot:TRINITY_DN21343_c0_g1_i1.p1 TRINITY_DN21343_c0_g1~~TRINITY_DN21343_c0_g1_i1.p1  ORF type:complete len:278 (+),score=90.49 TRINITY_DN21343_c0_g1_i1:48-836(+)